MKPFLFKLGLLDNIDVNGSNGSSVVVFENQVSSLLDLDLLGLLTENSKVGIPVTPGMPIDRLTVELNSLLGVSLDQPIKIFNVRKAPAKPALDPNLENLAICAGANADLDSGQTFATDNLIETSTFFVTTREKGCLDESSKLGVEVIVVPIPIADNITVEIIKDGIVV